MGRETSIGWCDSTANCEIGCDGCELGSRSMELAGVCTCYAFKINQQYSGGNKGYPKSFWEPMLKPGVMAAAAKWSDLRGTRRRDKPWLDGFPRLIFPCDMGDLFSKGVPFEFIETEVFDVASSELGRRHIWQILTKRPKRLLAFEEWLWEKRGVRWPSNVWTGVSVTRQSNAVRVRDLSLSSASLKFVSLEPMLESVDLQGWTRFGVRLVIVGGASGARDIAAPFSINWADEVIRHFRGTATCVFIKQLGSNPCHDVDVEHGIATRIRCHFDRKGEDWSKWPQSLRVREMPLAGGVTVEKGASRGQLEIGSAALCD